MKDLNLENVLDDIQKDLTKSTRKKKIEDKEDKKFLEDLAHNTPNSDMFMEDE